MAWSGEHSFTFAAPNSATGMNGGLTSRTASITATREQFYSVLADLAADCVDREPLLGELSRIALRA